MKRRILIALGILVVLYVAYREGKGYVKDWYADNYMVRTTADPATPQPDHVCLTWSADPHTTMTVQWRTAPTVTEGAVEYREKDQPEAAVTRLKAERSTIEDRLVENDPANARFAATLSGLDPATTYLYRAGHEAAWTDWTPFTTAPAEPADFSFLYWGDVQLGFDFWDKLACAAYERHPDIAFNILAGDLVNNGDYRNQWDSFFDAAEGLFDRAPIVPALGNHDYAKEEVPRHYLDLFTLPENGPKGFPPERAYSFTYGNALFIVLDSNLEPEDQAPWLEEQLKGSKATWKLVMYHHPAYPSAPHRANDEVRDIWGALFDKYGVDVAFQGHDHAYLRTYPMRAGKRAPTGREGTVYVVSNAGGKYYEQEDHDYAEVAFPDVSTYQVVDIATNPDRLTYRAFDLEGTLRDQFTLEK